MLVLGGAAWGAAAATGNAGPAGSLVDFIGGNKDDDYIQLLGTIVSISSDTLTVSTPTANVPFAITSETEFQDANSNSLLPALFLPGARVEVRALERDGVLVAREVELEDANENDEADNSGPASPNSGPGSGEGDGADNATAEDDGDNNSGPGNGDLNDDGEDDSGPGSGEDDQDGHSGPGSGDDNASHESDDEDD